MTYSEERADLFEREKLVKKWSRRLKRLAKVKGMNQAQFCAKHGLSDSILSKQKTMKMKAQWESITAVERALKKEGV